jgi:hypothetical protein
LDGFGYPCCADPSASDPQAAESHFPPLAQYLRSILRHINFTAKFLDVIGGGALELTMPERGSIDSHRLGNSQLSIIPREIQLWHLRCCGIFDQQKVAVRTRSFFGETP